MMKRDYITVRIILLFSALLIAGCQVSSDNCLYDSKALSAEHGRAWTLNADAPYRLSNRQSRAVTQENPTGGKGLGGKDRGNGNCRKGAPAFRNVRPGEIKTLCDIEGSGMVRHIWMTVEDRSPEMMRSYIIRIYWDDSKYPSVEAPMGDLFGVAHGRTANYMTPYLGMPEGRGFQCYFPMPFSKRCRITFENDSPNAMPWLFYQVDYTLGDTITDDMGRFHAHFRRQNPCPIDQDYCLLDTQGLPGVFVGAMIGCNPKSPGWWGEGEMKFYIDGDDKYPTICGTGTEDYLCSGWGMYVHSAIYTGVNYRKKNPSGLPQFVSFYRFHVLDPIYFQSGLRVELQQLGAGDPGERPIHVHPDVDRPGQTMSSWLYDRSDDYCSVVYWYQPVSNKPLPPIPTRQERIVGIEKQPWE